ncbi:MAG TPA: hypothetical protein VF485_01575 [Sphingomonas sp.]
MSDHLVALIEQAAKVRSFGARPPVGRHRIEQQFGDVAERRALPGQIVDTEHGSVTASMGKRHIAKRGAVADCAPEGRGGLNARRVSVVWMKINAEAAAPGRGKAGRQPER